MPISRDSQRGSALLTVLWLTAALAAIGLTVANNVRGETERAQTGLDETRASFTARGAIERALLHIQWSRQYFSDDGRPLYYTPGAPVMDLSFPDAQVRVEVIPESSKLNVNSIPAQELLALLAALNVPEAQAYDIAAAIIDWRTQADPLRPSSFDAFYLAQTPSFSARHASFMENEEMLLVKGITPELFYGTSLDGSQAGLRDCLSIYGSGYAVDINTAREATLRAVGIPAQDAATLIRSRAERPILDSKELGALALTLGPAAQRLRVGGQSMFTIRATARIITRDGRLSDLRRTVGALVKITFPGNQANKPPGTEILRWYDRI